MDYSIKLISENPEYREAAAIWFHRKWGIPYEAYLDSMNECIARRAPFPEWYIAFEDGRIIGGLGVIENDFHSRKDLSPNICAVYTEENRRGLGVAGKLLSYACEDMKNRGIDTLYLLTDHTSFYERYGWEFFCMVQGDIEGEISRMYVHRSR